jgi:hypothetical protein
MTSEVKEGAPSKQNSGGYLLFDNPEEKTQLKTTKASLALI